MFFMFADGLVMLVADVWLMVTRLNNIFKPLGKNENFQKISIISSSSSLTDVSDIISYKFSTNHCISV